jgi:hypothetical protein
MPALVALASLFRISQVPPASAAATVVTAGVSSSSLEGVEPLPKKTHSKACLSMSSRYVCVWGGRLHPMRLVAPIFVPELKEGGF